MLAAEKNKTISKCAVIILAAGASNRLGHPKQLLMYKGRSLLRNVLDISKNVTANPVIVVLGASSNLTTNEITDDENICKLINDKWSEGISSSIRCAVNFLQQEFPLTDGAIILVCDQPFITGALINDLITIQKKTGKPIVASSYSDTVGTPVLFHKSFFPELMNLSGDTGAKKIILQHPDSVVTVPFPEGNIDIDTAGDYEALRDPHS